MNMTKVAVMLAFAIGAITLVMALEWHPAVETLAYSCVYGGDTCLTTTDTTVGTCRTLAFATTDGPLQVQVCGKDDGRYELYLQQYPFGAQPFTVTVGTGSVNNIRGYDSFNANTLPPNNNSYPYVDVATFDTTCTFNGVACMKTSDDTAGTCRTVLYDTDGNASTTEIALLACHKEGSRYELYRVFAPSGDLYATLGPMFVDGIKGFDSFTLQAPPIVPPVINVTPPACTESVTTLNATCIDGNITEDMTSGVCRAVTCESATGSLQILACDKPDNGAKTYFEMYRWSNTGTPLDICLGDTCLDSDLRGFARSENFCTT